MVSRFSFSPGGRGGNDPWFRIGTFDVTTPAIVVAMGLLSMMVWGIEGGARSVSKHLWLIQNTSVDDSVLDGRIWRLVTWPFVNEPDIFALLMFAIFYMLGSQLEGLVGRKRFVGLLLAITVIPALVATVLDLMAGIEGGALGFRWVELGVLSGFAAQFSHARFWPGIPAPILAGVIVGIEFFSELGDRNTYGVVMVLGTAAVGVLGLRSLGYLEHLPQIPRIPLPAGWAVDSRPRSAGARPSSSRSRSKARGTLSVVPGSPDDHLREMEIDALLDRVAENGFDSLTKGEQAKLREHSKRMRRERE